MKNFIRLVFLSILYAVFFVIEVELILNVYRISRLINVEVELLSIFIAVIIILLVTLSTYLFYVLNKRYLKRSKWNYLSCLICMPFIFLFISLFTSLFPMINEGDRPAPILGLFYWISLVIYPFYLSIIIGIAGNQKRNR